MNDPIADIADTHPLTLRLRGKSTVMNLPSKLRACSGRAAERRLHPWLRGKKLVPMAIPPSKISLKITRANLLFANFEAGLKPGRRVTWRQ